MNSPRRPEAVDRVGQRLPKGYFDRLTGQCWYIGQVSAKHLIESAPAPSTLTKSYNADDMLLELGFDLRLDQISGANEVTGYQVTLSEVMPYEQDPELDLYFYRKLDLKLRSHRRAYSIGATVAGESTVIELNLTTPGSGAQRKFSSLVWRQQRGALEGTFGPAEFEYFTGHLAHFATEVTSNPDA